MFYSNKCNIEMKQMEDYMWGNKELKTQAKKALKRNYWKIITACLIVAFLTGTSTVFFNNNSIDLETANILKKIPNANILNETIELLSKAGSSIKDFITNSTTNGILYTVFNNITKYESLVFGFLNSINQIIFNDISKGIIILVGLLIVLLYVFLIGNILKVGESRFCLENNNYPNTPVTRFLFIFRIKKAKNVAKIMFFKSLYLSLWSLTIVGGIIKFYSYRMIPYILAENPAISKKEAFFLSSKMMKGNKFKVFLLDLSFVLWEIASFMTFGILGILFVNPYRKMTLAGLYIKLREEVINSKIMHYQKLNDTYLYKIPIENYDKEEGIYPVELFTIKEDLNRTWITIDYNKDYSIQTVIFLFFAYSAAGWIWEIFLNLLNYGTIVNKGVMLGPWLPIYGSGGVLMLVLFKKWRDKPIIIFFLCALIATLIEYGTGWYLETFKGFRWWDYSGYILNINGYISLENSIGFGMSGFITIYFVAPILDNLFKKISIKSQTILCILLASLFLIDFIHSIDNPNKGNGITVPAEPKQLQLDDIIYNSSK